jgi:hypothetical protein
MKCLPQYFGIDGKVTVSRIGHEDGSKVLSRFIWLSIA